jgi:hypothetical protein
MRQGSFAAMAREVVAVPFVPVVPVWRAVALALATVVLGCVGVGLVIWRFTNVPHGIDVAIPSTSESPPPVRPTSETKTTGAPTETPNATTSHVVPRTPSATVEADAADAAVEHRTSTRATAPPATTPPPELGNPPVPPAPSPAAPFASAHGPAPSPPVPTARALDHAPTLDASADAPHAPPPSATAEAPRGPDPLTSGAYTFGASSFPDAADGGAH